MWRVLSQQEVPLCVIPTASTEDTDTVLQHFVSENEHWEDRSGEASHRAQSISYNLQTTRGSSAVWPLNCVFTIKKKN